MSGIWLRKATSIFMQETSAILMMVLSKDLWCPNWLWWPLRGDIWIMTGLGKNHEFQVSLWTGKPQIVLALAWASLNSQFFIKLTKDLPRSLPIEKVIVKSNLPKRINLLVLDSTFFKPWYHKAESSELKNVYAIWISKVYFRNEKLRSLKTFFTSYPAIWITIPLAS